MSLNLPSTSICFLFHFFSLLLHSPFSSLPSFPFSFVFLAFLYSPLKVFPVSAFSISLLSSFICIHFAFRAQPIPGTVAPACVTQVEKKDEGYTFNSYDDCLRFVHQGRKDVQQHSFTHTSSKTWRRRRKDKEYYINLKLGIQESENT